MSRHNLDHGNIHFADSEDDSKIHLSQVIDDVDRYLSSNTFRIVYQTNNFFLPQIQQMIESKKTINLRPEYQRRLNWSKKKKSRLIESLLLNIPIPPIFLFESEAARYEVLDGQQRMNAIQEFLGNDHSLNDLGIFKPLNGKRYSDCSQRVQRTLERASISAIVFLLENDTVSSMNAKIVDGSPRLTNLDIRRLVFNRINTGGLNLNPQEIRSAMNPGLFNDAIIELTRWRPFTDAFDIPSYKDNDINSAYTDPKRQGNSLFKTMKDCEIVLRFFALREEENIRGSMREMLDRAMEKPRSPEEVHRAVAEYKNIFSRLFELFDKRPFRLRMRGRDAEKISVPLYDGLMVAMGRLLSENPERKFIKKSIIDRLSAATERPDEYDVIVGRANTADAVRERIEMMVTVLNG